MYFLLMALLALSGIYLISSGIMKARRAKIVGGIVTLILTAFFFAFLSFWGEMLWFESLGYSRRFWIVVFAKTGSVVFGAFLAASIIALLTWPAVFRNRLLRYVPPKLGALVGGLWGFAHWETLLLFLNRTSAGVSDPILNRDAGFYLFVLPLYDALYFLLTIAVIASGATVVFATFQTGFGDRLRLNHEDAESPSAFRSLLLCSAVLAALFAWGKILSTYHLLYSDWGVVAGPGWTDVHIRLPALRIIAGVTLLLGVAPLVPAIRDRLHRLFCRFTTIPSPAIVSIGGAWVSIGVTWILGLVLVPVLIQWLVVEPNEITFEKPYIAHNIEFTRKGFRLDDIEERKFPANDVFTREMARENSHLLSEVRLWDWRALDAVYKQFQEMRLYFEFHDVDMDRYSIGDRYRQVMISAREMEKSNLPEQSRTFVNERFKYTHGYGLAMSTVSDFTPTGLPKLLIKDIPPKAEFPNLNVDTPQIYYGELTRDAVVVNSTEDEFDHPSGDENVYTQYEGEGGVRLENLWRKFVYGWKLDGTQFFFSAYMTPESRVMFHRQIIDRISTVAPFLNFDNDPYLVLADNKMYWMVDAYTASSYFPYSEPYSPVNSEDQLAGKNYVRNSVKAVVDAFNGTVDFYVFDEEDALVRAWQKAFPGLFKERSAMPEALQSHIRYPEDFLLAQGLVYAKYHMSDPEVFYNQEDLWVRATEKYYSRIQAVEPYYVMWQLPGEDQGEFVLMLPFTPKNKQVLIGWIAGMCDGDNYGRFLAYKFPKEKRVLGPQQLETKIDQDRFLSGQLTLWDQRGSNVIRGNVLAIPIADTLLYVEPIYLQAETAAYPELRLIVIMHGDRISYAENFEDALSGLFKDGIGSDTRGLARDLQEIAKEAEDAFEEYLRLQAEQQFEKAAQELEQLRDLLREMTSNESQ